MYLIILLFLFTGQPPAAVQRAPSPGSQQRIVSSAQGLYPPYHNPQTQNQTRLVPTPLPSQMIGPTPPLHSTGAQFARYSHMYPVQGIMPGTSAATHQYMWGANNPQEVMMMHQQVNSSIIKGF